MTHDEAMKDGRLYIGLTVQADGIGRVIGLYVPRELQNQEHLRKTVLDVVDAHCEALIEAGVL